MTVKKKRLLLRRMVSLLETILKNLKVVKLCFEELYTNLILKFTEDIISGEESSDFDFTYGPQTEVSASCAFIFKGVQYIFGGSSERNQVLGKTDVFNNILLI